MKFSMEMYHEHINFVSNIHCMLKLKTCQGCNIFKLCLTVLLQQESTEQETIHRSGPVNCVISNL